jgi:hypothetical protein
MCNILLSFGLSSGDGNERILHVLHVGSIPRHTWLRHRRLCLRTRNKITLKCKIYEDLNLVQHLFVASLFQKYALCYSFLVLYCKLLFLRWEISSRLPYIIVMVMSRSRCRKSRIRP